MLRDSGVALIGSFLLVVGVVNCWVTPPSGSPLPTAPLTPEQRVRSGTIARDALLDSNDMLPDLTPRAIGVESGHPATLQAYLDDGWMAVASNAWTNGGAGDVYLLQQSVYVFEDTARAAAFVEALAVGMAEVPGATKAAGLPDPAVGYERIFTRQGQNERRTLEIATVVGRLVLNIDYELAAARDDWLDASRALLSTAIARATEALTAAGE